MQKHIIDIDGFIVLLHRHQRDDEADADMADHLPYRARPPYRYLLNIARIEAIANIMSRRRVYHIDAAHVRAKCGRSKYLKARNRQAMSSYREYRKI